MNPLVIIQIIAIALPLLLELIKWIEGQIPQAGAGAEKKATVISLFTEIWKNVSASDPKLQPIPVELLQNLLGQTIDFFVGIFNLTGAFPKAVKPA